MLLNSRGFFLGVFVRILHLAFLSAKTGMTEWLKHVLLLRQVAKFEYTETW